MGACVSPPPPPPPPRRSLACARLVPLTLCAHTLAHTVWCLAPVRHLVCPHAALHTTQHNTTKRQQQQQHTLSHARPLHQINHLKNPRSGSSSKGARSLTRQVSIYETYSLGVRATTLLVISLASMLVPFSDTIYLPALPAIAAYFGTTMEVVCGGGSCCLCVVLCCLFCVCEGVCGWSQHPRPPLKTRTTTSNKTTKTKLVAASVSIYMFLVGLSVIVWGPASDRFGRKRVFLLGAVLFVAASFVCAFAPSIAVLVAFRALQGAVGESGVRLVVFVCWLVCCAWPPLPTIINQHHLKQPTHDKPQQSRSSS